MKGKKQQIALETTQASLHDIHKNIRELLNKESKSTRDLVAQVIDYYETIIRCMPGNVYWMDKNCTTIGCNQNVLDMFGLKTQKDFYNLTFEEMEKIGSWDKNQAAKFKKDTIKAIKTGEAVKNEEEPPIPGSDGEDIHFLTTRTPLFNAKGNVIGIVGISTDITDRKKTEKALQKEKEKAEVANQAKSNFLAVISHELRTPLNGIIGLTQVLLKKPLHGESRELAQNIYHAGEHLLNLINAVLDFTKLEAGKTQLSPSAFELKAFIKNIANSMTHQIEGNKIELTVHYEEALPEKIIADELRLKQILVNLLSNAIKFTEQGYIKLKVFPVTNESLSSDPDLQKALNMTTLPKGKTFLEFGVQDTGAGIPESKLETVFERFTQIDSQFSRRYQGSGLGLSICKQLAELMGGTIKLKSKLSEGSTFRVIVPVGLPKVTTTKKKTQPTSLTTSEEKFKMSILLVEDHPINQKVAELMLKELGCQVDTAPDGAKAIELARANHYDLILMDISLPDMNGMETTKKIRNISEKLKKTPIIAVTAHALEQTKQEILDAGLNDIIIKPIKETQLISLLRSLVKNSFSHPNPASNETF